MPASMSSVEAGRRLRAARVAVQLSTRDVERLSRKLAQEKSSQDYYISHAWVSDVEKGEFTPSIYKLYSLSIIYKRSYSEILSYFSIHLSDIGRDQMSFPLPRTHLIEPRAATREVEIPDDLKGKLPLKHTNLVSRMFGDWGAIPVSLLSRMDASAVYGYVGMEDFTLFPLIRPGSFVEIDAKQKRIEHSNWSNEFDRPIYFVELRDSYACSWCEVRDDRLLLVPHPQSRRQVRQIRYPLDADIVGRVTAVSMRVAGGT